MRQSGFFDLVVGMLILALVLGILWGIGLISYNATFHAHAVLAAGDGPVPATLEEARLLPDFVEYNFKQDLNLLAQSYGAFGTLALILVGVALSACCTCALCLPSSVRTIPCALPMGSTARWGSMRWPFL